MADWWKYLTYAVAPITSFFSQLGTGFEKAPVDAIWDWMNDDQTGAASGVLQGAAASASGTGPVVQPTDLSDTSQAGLSEIETVDSATQDALDSTPSIQAYFHDNPNATANDLLTYMAQNGNDEWTEKWIDYYLEKQAIDEANAYTASREDTAYQRLVEDLKKAGLNPAMMFGSTATTHAAGSIGAANIGSGATSSSISNYSKLKKLILAYMALQLTAATGLTNSIGKGLTSLLGLL